MAFTEKFLRVPGVIEAGGRHVKRYHISSFEEEIEPEIQQAAYRLLPGLLPAPSTDNPPASFVVLHRGPGAAYLCVYSWVWGNVIDCRTAVAGVTELGCDDLDPSNFKVLTSHWIGCVWELAPFGHERSAWVRHILAPVRADLAGYLADVLTERLVGGPR